MLQLWDYKDFTLAQEVDKVIQEYGKTYEAAVLTINIMKRRYDSQTYYTNEALPKTRKYLQHIGYKVSDLNRLNIIHITGTKGKGSTSSYCENILRQYGYKTGMLSSPHVTSMTERFVLQGKPVDKDVFARHFWTICGKLMDSMESDDDLPRWAYFNTLLGFDICMSSGINALVMEVGIGGEWDSTNVIEAPVACGITSLEIDHVSDLGNTLESIAWHKSGIFKRGCHALSVPQDPSAMKVLQERAAEKGAMFSVVPILDDKSNCDKPIKLGIAGKVQIKNASLAVQLCRKWLEICHPGFSLNSETLIATASDISKTKIKQLPSFQLTPEMIQDEYHVYEQQFPQWFTITLLNYFNYSVTELQGERFHVRINPEKPVSTLAEVDYNYDSDHDDRTHCPLCGSVVIVIGSSVAAVVARRFAAFALRVLQMHSIRPLATTHLPGRMQIVRHPGVTYYLDAAHTDNSIINCGEWFGTESEKERDALKLNTARILIFSGAHNRDPVRHLTLLKKSVYFDAAVFVPKQDNCSMDKLYLELTAAEEAKNMQACKDVWNASDTEVSKEEEESQSTKPVVSNERIAMWFPTFKEGLVAASLGRCAKVLESREQGKASKDDQASNGVQEGLKSNGPRQYDEYLSSLNLPAKFRDFEHVQILITGGFRCVGLAAWYLGAGAW